MLVSLLQDSRLPFGVLKKIGGTTMENKMVFTGVLFSLLAITALAQTTTIDFEKDKLGESPGGFSFALTGKGKPGVWVIKKDESSSNQKNVLAQTDADPTGYRFPVAVFDGINAKDVDVSI